MDKVKKQNSQYSININVGEIKDYIRKDIRKEYRKTIRVRCLDTEKKRTYLVRAGDQGILLKFNLKYFNGEERSYKMINERLSLDILDQYNVKNIPRVFGYDPDSSIFGTDVLSMSFIPDTNRILGSVSLLKLERVVYKIHSITSNGYFTVPYGNFSKKIKGNAYDFVDTYIKVLKSDVVKNDFMGYFIKKLHLQAVSVDALRLIEKSLFLQKNDFIRIRTFSLIHGHIARNTLRKHILIDKKNGVYIIDWENVCFGERELDLAAFKYENYTTSSKLKDYFIDVYNSRNPISYKKIFIYMFLLQLDDIIEILKKTAFLSQNEKTIFRQQWPILKGILNKRRYALYNFYRKLVF